MEKSWLATPEPQTERGRELVMPYKVQISLVAMEGHQPQRYLQKLVRTFKDLETSESDITFMIVDLHGNSNVSWMPSGQQIHGFVRSSLNNLRKSARCGQFLTKVDTTKGDAVEQIAYALECEVVEPAPLRKSPFHGRTTPATSRKSSHQGNHLAHW